jgi:hypothetical protein
MNDVRVRQATRGDSILLFSAFSHRHEQSCRLPACGLAKITVVCDHTALA